MRPLLLFPALLGFAIVGVAQPGTDSLRAVLAHAGRDTTAVRALNELAVAYSRELPDSTVALGTRALALAEAIGDRPGMAEALKNIGGGHAAGQRFAIARAYYDRSFEQWSALGDRGQMASLQRKLGYVAESQGDMPEAIKQNLAALRHYEAAHDTATVAQLKTALASVYDRMEEGEQAVALQREALALFEALRDTLGIAQSSNNLGTMLDELGRYDEALPYLERALAMARALGNPYGEVMCMGSIANHYQHMGDMATALQRNEQLLPLVQQLGSPYHEAALRINMGEILTALKRYDEARAQLEQGVAFARTVGAHEWLRNGHAALYELAEAQGNTAAGLEHYKLFIAYRDSIENEANTRKAVQEQMQYDFEKKEAVAKAAHEQELRRQKLVRNGFMGGFALVALFAGVFFFQRNRISKEKARSEELLLNILPEEVAEELKAKGSAEAVHIDQVTVLFTDFKGFTAMSETLSPQELVRDLNECFSAFDHITARYGIEKIKTIGDAYMAAGGLPTPNTTHATDVINAAFEMRDFIAEGKARKVAAGLPYFEIRIGVHTGPVVAGIVGVKKFSYDIWGDTVNTASRMESSGEVGKVNISEATHALVKDTPGLTFTPRGKVQAKGKGELEMFFARRAMAAQEATGTGKN
ncbi:MAG: tetratricopeptide repeat protein [Flavobacteriales bacterium]|nr:tetratricopeptide repeat protein [Flavobacteriales bacterium]